MDGLIKKSHPHYALVKSLGRAIWWCVQNRDVPIEAIYVYNGQFNAKSFSNYGADPETAGKVARALGGKVEKQVTDGVYPTFTLKKKDLNPGFDDNYEWEASREAVCRKRVVATETVETPAIEAQPAGSYEREIVEWDCPTILGGEVDV